MLEKLFPEDEILILNQWGKVIHRYPEGTSGWKPGLLGRLAVLCERFPTLQPDRLTWTTATAVSEGLPPMPLLEP